MKKGILCLLGCGLLFGGIWIGKSGYPQRLPSLAQLEDDLSSKEGLMRLIPQLKNKNGQFNAVLPVSEFKSKCLSIIDEVFSTHIERIVSKHGKPMVRIVPVSDKKKAVFGCMKGTVHIKGDIYSTGESWNAEA